MLHRTPAEIQELEVEGKLTHLLNAAAVYLPTAPTGLRKIL